MSEEDTYCEKKDLILPPPPPDPPTPPKIPYVNLKFWYNSGGF